MRNLLSEIGALFRQDKKMNPDETTEQKPLSVLDSVRRDMDDKAYQESVQKRQAEESKLLRKRGLEQRKRECFAWINSTECADVLASCKKDLEKTMFRVGEVVADEENTRVYLTWKPENKKNSSEYRLDIYGTEAGEGSNPDGGYNYIHLVLSSKFDYQIKYQYEQGYQLTKEQRSKEDVENAIAYIAKREPLAFGITPLI